MLAPFQAGDSSGGAAAKPVDLESHVLSEGDEQVCKGGVVLLVVGEVRAVPVAAPGHHDGQVVPIVSTGVAGV